MAGILYKRLANSDGCCDVVLTTADNDERPIDEAVAWIVIPGQIPMLETNQKLVLSPDKNRIMAQDLPLTTDEQVVKEFLAQIDGMMLPQKAKDFLKIVAKRMNR